MVIEIEKVNVTLLREGVVSIFIFSIHADIIRFMPLQLGLRQSGDRNDFTAYVLIILVKNHCYDLYSLSCSDLCSCVQRVPAIDPWHYPMYLYNYRIIRINIKHACKTLFPYISNFFSVFCELSIKMKQQTKKR